MRAEEDLTEEFSWYREEQAGKCIAALARNNIKGHWMKGRDEACSKLLDLIPEGASIGVGDSVTLLQVGIIQALERRNANEIFNPFRKDGQSRFPGRGDTSRIGKQALLAGVFLTSINAITLDGKLINVDGFGNRVSALVFGPRKVFVVCGTNKIAPDVDHAMRRVREVAAPLNARRHHLKHGLASYPPCASMGSCSDCRHPRRICCYTLIVEYQWHPRIEVVLVGEDLGL